MKTQITFLLFIVFSISSFGQEWEDKYFSFNGGIVFDMLVISEDSLFSISKAAVCYIYFSSDGGDTWLEMYQTTEFEHFSAFDSRSEQVIIAGNRVSPDTTAFILDVDLGFTQIDTIEIPDIKEIKYFSKSEAENVYFVFEDHFGNQNIGVYDLKTQEVLLDVGNYSSKNLIDQLYFFGSGVVYIRDSFEIFKSSDFGNTWVSISPAGTTFNMDFFDDKNGVYAKSYKPPPPALFNGSKTYMTHDGGQTWKMVLETNSGGYSYFKLISEHTVIGTDRTTGTTGGPYADLFNDFQPFKIKQLLHERLLPYYMQPIIQTDSCTYLSIGNFFKKTCESSGLVNSNKLAESPSIEIYPNPASEQITVKTPIAFSGNFRIYDAIGQLHFQQKIESGETGIQIGDLKTGLYFIVHEAFGRMGSFIKN